MIASTNNAHFYFEAKDVPIFHYFKFPELASFKFYFWMKTILNDSRFEKKKFEPDLWMEPLIKTGKEIARVYTGIYSSEIWIMETVNSSILQIEFCNDSGYFHSPNDRKKVYEQLFKLIEHIEDEAYHGEKFMPGTQPTGKKNFNLYINEVLLGHNTMLVDADEKKSAYINHSVLNFMITYNEKFCRYIKTSLENIISKSNLISQVNERERKKFFNKLKGFVKGKMES